MANVAGLVANLTRLQVQEQAEDSSGAPPDYEGRIVLDPILLDAGRLMAALETGVFELRNTRVHQNLLLHHIGRSMAWSAVFLWELCAMAGRVYRLTDLLGINWLDLDGVEFRHREGPWPQEGLPVREEIVEDDAGVISSVVVPDLAPVPEDTMEEESSVESPNN